MVGARRAVPGVLKRNKEANMSFMRSADPKKALIISVLLFLNVTILGCLLLMVTGKVVF